LAELSSPTNQDLMMKMNTTMQKASQRGLIDWQDWGMIEVWLKHTANNLTKKHAASDDNNDWQDTKEVCCRVALGLPKKPGHLCHVQSRKVFQEIGSQHHECS
jgi:hypothetical protein